jgi:hypothetical protein
MCKVDCQEFWGDWTYCRVPQSSSGGVAGRGTHQGHLTFDHDGTDAWADSVRLEQFSAI